MITVSTPAHEEWFGGLSFEFTPFHLAWLCCASPHYAEYLINEGILPTFPLCGLDFSGLDLTCAHFDRLDMTGCNFSGCRLRETSFRKTILRYTKWDGAIGWRTDFTCAELSGARFKGAVLQQPNFSRANLTDASFAGAGIADITWDGVLANGVELL